MINTLRSIRRLTQITRTLARYNLLPLLSNAGISANMLKIIHFLAMIRQNPAKDFVSKTRGERLAVALTALGPVFIKIGQALSVRQDIIGDDIARDLSSLRDRLPPFPTELAKMTIESELGKPLDSLYSKFDDKPAAAASIAQVHFAITLEGDPVAVKVLRPGIEQAFARELDFIYWTMDILEKCFPKIRRLKLKEAINVISDTIAQELDLRLEAAAGDELRTNFAHDQTFKVPKMDWKRTNRRVLTVERVDGLSITNGSELREQGYDTGKIVTDLARVVFLQVFRDGFFHADLHPGNIFITSDLSIRPVDFGIMGRIDRPTRLYLAEILMGFLNRNYEQVSRAHFKAGYVPSNQSEAAFAQAARAIAEPILELPLKDISLAQLLAQLFRVTERFKMETQPQLLLLQKTMLVAEGVGRDLHPETNMWELARPLITQWVNENMSPETQAADLAADARKIIENLPNIISKMAENSGPKQLNELKLHEDTINILTKKNSKQWVFYTSIVIVLFALAIS